MPQQPDQTKITDIGRILLGETPASFLIEVAVRAFITYILLLLATRLMGKRVAGQMSVTELTIIVTLGAAIGVPLQAPERGMLAAVVILIIAILYERGIGYFSFRSRKAEVTLQGDVCTVVRDGCIDLKAMKKNGLSRERLYSVLRQNGMLQLGEAKRVYLEADGHFSIFRDPKPPLGLCLLPAEDLELYQKQLSHDGKLVCTKCGKLIDQGEPPKEGCPRCGAHEWSEPVRSVDLNEFRSADDLEQDEQREHRKTKQ